jgi:hypothetical protein
MSQMLAVHLFAIVMVTRIVLFVLNSEVESSNGLEIIPLVI